MKQLFLVLSFFLFAITADAQIELVKDINTIKIPQSADPGEHSGFFQLGNFLYFDAQTEDGTSLCKTDGTPAGTMVIKNFSELIANEPSIIFLTELAGRLWFVANDGVYGEELWVTDGTASGTFMVKDINPGKKNTDIHS